MTDITDYNCTVCDSAYPSYHPQRNTHDWRAEGMCWYCFMDGADMTEAREDDLRFIRQYSSEPYHRFQNPQRKGNAHGLDRNSKTA